MLPPLIGRELRIALHRDARRQWHMAAWVAGGITIIFLLIIGGTGIRSTGRTLFHWLFGLGCIGVANRAFGLTADLFSEERRNGTLGLLVLTGVRPFEIFAHKLLGAAWIATYSLLGALPFFAIPFLTGGVLPTEFLCALVFLTNALLFCIAMGLLGSVLHSEGGQAQLTAVVAAAFLCLATPFAYWVSRQIPGMGALDESWLALSPAHAPELIFTGFSGSSLQLFWTCSSFTLTYTLGALLLAAVILQRTWREGSVEFAPTAWVARWRKWIFGKTIPPAGVRERQLDRNSFCWIASRDRWPVLMAQVFIAALALLWIDGWCVWGRGWANVGTALACSLGLHFGLNWILACASGRRLGEERQTGGLEVLLTTPLSVEELLDGQFRALWIQFRKPFVAMVALDLAFIGGGFAAAGWNPLSVAACLCLWVLLFFACFAAHRETACKAMWISVWTGRPVYAATQATGHTFLPLVWGPILFRDWFSKFPRGDAAEMIAVTLLGLIVLGLAARCFNRKSVIWSKLQTELRLIACAPIPARGDKRFKRWEPGLIFPPGRWGELKLRAAKPGSTHATATATRAPLRR